MSTDEKLLNTIKATTQRTPEGGSLRLTKKIKYETMSGLSP